MLESGIIINQTHFIFTKGLFSNHIVLYSVEQTTLPLYSCAALE